MERSGEEEADRTDRRGNDQAPMARGDIRARRRSDPRRGGRGSRDRDRTFGEDVHRQLYGGVLTATVAVVPPVLGDIREGLPTIRARVLRPRWRVLSAVVAVVSCIPRDVRQFPSARRAGVPSTHVHGFESRLENVRGRPDRGPGHLEGRVRLAVITVMTIILLDVRKFPTARGARSADPGWGRDRDDFHRRWRIRLAAIAVVAVVTLDICQFAPARWTGVHQLRRPRQELRL